MHKTLIVALILLFASSAAANPDDYALHQINSTHWYFETTQNDLSEGTYSYQAFANNISSDYRILNVDMPTPPDPINLENTTGNFWVNHTWQAPTAGNVDTFYLIVGDNDGVFSGYNWAGTTWQSDSTITSGLGDVGDRSDPAVFNMSGIWYLIAGNAAGGFYGYNWTGSAWQQDSAINASLGDIGFWSTPTVFQNDSTWYLIAGEVNGVFYGYNWTGSAWQQDSAINASLGDIGDNSNPTVFQKDSTWYLITGELYGGFYGYNWTGSAWQQDSAINASLTTHAFYSSPTIFIKGSTWYVITADFGSVFYGYNWTGSAWQSDSSIISGITTSKPFMNPKAFNMSSVNNVTDSYNVSVNTVWHNTSPAYYNDTYTAHAWQNITVYAYNSTGIGTLSTASISQNTQIPNNAITITNTSGWNGNAGANVYVDYDATDADSDAPTFSCNRTDLFTDFSTSTGKGNWTSSAGTYYVDFGVSDGYGSTSNYTMTITVSIINPTITLRSQTPSTLYQNSTGYMNISYGITHDSAGLNNTSVSFLFRNYDHATNDANHSIRPPANNISEMWNFDGQIMRAANRNETLNFENNATITGGDIFTWSGMDENNTRLTIVPVNSTYTIVHINGTIHDLAMEQMWYLDRTDLIEAPKTQLSIHKTQDVLIKFWNAEIFKGNYNFIGIGYTDTSLKSAPALQPSDANPVSFYYLNSSYDPLGGVDPLDSKYAVFMGSMNATQWVDHIYSPDQNASYVRGATNNTLLNSVIDTTEISYIYFHSHTPSSKPYYINITDANTNTNRTFGQTDVLWIGDTAPYTAHPYTPNMWFAFIYDNTSFDHKLYVADNNDIWGNSTLQSTNIGAGLFPPTTPTIHHFQFNDSTDCDLNRTYSGIINVGIGVGTDPDGGTVTHNLTLHYTNKTFVAIINNTFTDTIIIGNGVYANISFNTTPYYSETEEYTLKVVATDNEGATAESWLNINFTLGTHQISNLHTTTLVYNRIVWEWTNPDHYNTIMVYLDNIWRQNTTGTSYIASGLAQTTSYTIKLITVYAGEESDPVTDTQITPAEQGGSGGGTPAPTPTPTATATPTITPLPDENVTENMSIIIEPIPEITNEIVMNDTISATVWHLSFDKHGVFVPQHTNIIACDAISPYSCRYYEDQKKFEIIIDGESPNPVFTSDQWVTFITRDGTRISQHVHTKVYNPLFYFTTPAISGSVGDFSRYFVHGDEYIVNGIRAWWLVLLVIGFIVWRWRRKP